MRQTPVQPDMDDQQFERIAAVTYHESGIRLVREKKLMVQSRLRHRLRALNMDAFSKYADYVASMQGVGERRFMISALTTNVSQFFREAQHFDLLSNTSLPAFRERIRQAKRIRIWSAGCSNGQEPYSIAMHLLSREPKLREADFRILATDIDPRVIAHAQTGRYTRSQLSGVPAEHLKRFTVEHPDGSEDRSVNETLKAIVSFRELNLFADWPMQFQFDAIFCRNVVIYFDQKTQERLWSRFNRALCPGGLLFLGHSERIATPAAHGFRSVGPTTYTKPGSTPVKPH
ncbi:protein-glutamate O-methyltransferase [Tateyamaria omphalii]|uniref:CheR family methyltransferase n=1 Tax=Tateyamaria omphalii TaxID=299262 RepID=UPI001C99A118|nr:protein-glutamate O-methyltransferase [Tateyamaria omphalii]MBY5932605.1 protein-glutamate O-methyltransferase [Tateyamaria omphalii]